MRAGLLACLASAIAGCQLPWMTGGEEIDSINYSRISDADSAAPEQSAEVLERVAEKQTTLSEEEALASVLDKLQEIGAIDPAAQRELMKSLREAKPEHYGLIVDQFRSALAYRQQVAAREAKQVPTEVVAAETKRPAPEAAGLPIPSIRPRELARRESVTLTAPLDLDPLSTGRSEASIVRSLPPPPDAQSTAQMQTLAQPVVYQTDVDDWQSQLDKAIRTLSSSVAAQPRTTGELHEHFRLRALQLLNGQQSEAMRPVPGATPAQQDYWAKQLYAVSAYLDDKAQGDEKQRAASALVHLDDARDRLSELAILQIRNLALVDSVAGFGDYELRKDAKFRPNEQATLYAEVQNFHSESTEEGFRTRLSTSYQVLDQSGTRVDGGQFPDVEDICKSRRRDFHMQYGIVLPARIYAGHYEVQLIVTDGKSKKIAQSSVPLEIVE